MNLSPVMILADLLPQMVLPLGVALELLVLALLLRRRAPRLSGTALIGALATLWVFSLPATSAALIGSLEGRYPALSIEQAPVADAIVLLGGGLMLPAPPRPDAQLGPGADRLLVAWRLWEAGRAPLIVLSAGGAEPGSPMSEADHTERLLVDWGVAPAAIVKEYRSRNTDENAAETARILERRGLGRVLLVTSASHMPRAMTLFRAEGIDAVPVPADHWIAGRTDHVAADWIPNAIALGGSTRALREYLGMLYYWVSGRVSRADIAPSASLSSQAWNTSSVHSRRV